MKAKDVLRKTADFHRGFMPISIWEHDTYPFCWNIAKTLRKIPHKISAYFKRDMITEVRKAKTTDHAGHYYLKLTDGTFLEVEY